MAEEVLFVVVFLQLGAERLPQAERIDRVFGAVFGRVFDVRAVERNLILAAADEVFNRNHFVLQKLHHLIVEAEPGLAGREHPCGNQRIDNVRGIDLLLREAECAGENVQVEFGVVEHEGTLGVGEDDVAIGVVVGTFARIIPKFNEPLLGGVEVEVATLAGRVRESDVVGVSERDVIALRNASVFCCGGEAKPDNATLHRVESVCFRVDADFGRLVEFLFHLFENIIAIDADVSGREVGGEACFCDFARIAGIGSAARFVAGIAVATARIARVAVGVAHKSCLARNVFEQANETVDFVFPENVFERIAVDAAEFKCVKVPAVGTLCL